MKDSDAGDDLKIRTEPPEYSQIKIDADSARMLHHLNNLETAEYATSRELLEATELSNTTQVCYRLDEHLIPGGLACERPYAEVEGHEEGDEWHGPREFIASSWTQHWVEQHGSSPLPVSEEVNQLRRDLDGEIERVEYQVEDIVESLDQLNQQVESLNGKIGGVKSRGKDRADRLDHAEARIEDIETQIEATGEIAEQVEAVEGALGDLAGRIERVERIVEDRDGDIDELSDRVAGLRVDCDSLSEQLTERAEQVDEHLEEIDDRLEEQRKDIDRSPWWAPW